MADAETLEDEELVADPGPSPKLPLIIGLIVGLIFGGGGAVAYFTFMSEPGESDPVETVEAVEEESYPYYFELDRITAPLLNGRKRIVGYVHLDVNIEVHEEDMVSYLDVREPILRHAANAALSQSGAGRADQPLQVDYDRIAQGLTQAFNEALGRDVVYAVRVKNATRL